MDTKTEEQIVQELEDDYQWRKGLRKNTQRLERRLELMLRDPMAKELIRMLQSWDPQEIELSGKALKVKQRLEKKWSVNVHPTARQKILYASHGLPYEDLLNSSGDKPFTITPHKGNEPLSFRHCCPASGKPFENSFRIGSKDDKVLFSVDLNKINHQDLDFIKSTVQRVIQKYRKDRIKDGRKDAFADLPELSFLYSWGQDTFERNLRFYDLHVEERLGFRLIAFLENFRKDGSRAYHQWLEELRSRPFSVGNHAAEEMNKDKNRISEDTVFRAVKCISKAIRGKPYSIRKKPAVRKTNRLSEPGTEVIEEWSCPTHGKDLQTGVGRLHTREEPAGINFTCKYCEELYEKFLKLIPEGPDSNSISLEADAIDHIAYVQTGRLVRHGTKTTYDEEEPI